MFGYKKLNVKSNVPNQVVESRKHIIVGKMVLIDKLRLEEEIENYRFDTIGNPSMLSFDNMKGRFLKIMKSCIIQMDI